MAQFECPVCGQGFEQRSRLERHLRTSHPPQAPSAAILESALSGIDFPQDRDGLVEYARENGTERLAEALSELPERRYRDAAEVARALGEIRRHEEKPSHQPSRLGGKRSS